MFAPPCVIDYLKEHRIPHSRINFPILDKRQQLYEADAIEFKRLGNAHEARRQYDLKKGSAAEWALRASRSSNYSLLDVGCGEGYLIHFANELGIHAEGLNLSVIESEIARHGVPNPKTYVMEWKPKHQRRVTTGSALRMPYPDATFCGVNCTGVLMMVPRAEKILNGSANPLDCAKKAVFEMSRVLKPKGTLNLITMRERRKTEDPKKAEGYIAFEEGAYKVYGKNGSIEKSGDVGIFDLLKVADFEVRDSKLLGADMGYWQIRARKA